MNQDYELPHDVDAEKELLSALLVKNGKIVPEVAAIVSVDDFYRPEHRIIYRVILELSRAGNAAEHSFHLSGTAEDEKQSRILVLAFNSRDFVHERIRSRARKNRQGKVRATPLDEYRRKSLSRGATRIPFAGRNNRETSSRFGRDKPLRHSVKQNGLQRVCDDSRISSRRWRNEIVRRAQNGL